ncbi:MAG: hypothetical protein KAT15_07225, partial [Bacteroidales bacterium]|nr:hypothetical protein [Bacteroidales bacterium]
MKELKYILVGLSLMLVLNANSQVVDYYSSVSYAISVPLGETADYISNTRFRGFSFEFGRFMTEDISIGFLFAWNVFNEEFPRDTYEFDNLRLTGQKYHYINAFPLMASGRY